MVYSGLADTVILDGSQSNVFFLVGISSWWGDGSRSSWFRDIAFNVATIIHRFLHKEEANDEPDGIENCAPILILDLDSVRIYQDPLPPHSVANEAANEGGEKVAVGEEEHVHAHICTTFVCEEDVRDRDLAKTLNWGSKETNKKTMTDPSPVVC